MTITELGALGGVCWVNPPRILPWSYGTPTGTFR